MSTTKVPDEPRAVDVRFEDRWLVVDLADGRRLSVPIEWFARLQRAAPEQRLSWRLIGRGEGIHWPAVDEDISVAALLVHRRPSTEKLGDDYCKCSDRTCDICGGKVYFPEDWFELGKFGHKRCLIGEINE